MTNQQTEQRTEYWPIDRLIFYARNPRKNDAVVDRLCSSIREFGFKISVLPRSDGEVICDEWSEAQVKAFRLLVNRSVTWADWDEELLALELHEIQESDFDPDLTGFDPAEIDKRWRLKTTRKPTPAPPLPKSSVSRPGDR